MENENQNPKQQLIARLKESNNVLVTVSRNPSVDQLSAAIGLTLMLNHVGKHATAVFSGKVPNTLEFLKPEETLEKNTDSLRDFIISLDKAKADKLRYKVEDTMVKIFITPYRTSLSEADLVFGQGDFNVGVVIAIGVVEKDDLDEAITSHGRILHDATVASVSTATSGQLGSINWVDNKASSLCEMLVPVCEALKANALDAQMATAFLTGIVAETDRFSNEKTSSDTMNTSAKLMAAGANQQLVATKLEEPAPEPETIPNEENNEDEPAAEDVVSRDGSLDINHSEEEKQTAEPVTEESSELPEIQPDHELEPEESEEEKNEYDEKPSRLILQPPTMGGTLTANSTVEGLEPSTDPMTVKPVDAPLLTHDDDHEPIDILAPLEESQELAPAIPAEPAPVIEMPMPEPVETVDEPFDPFKQDPALAAPAPLIVSDAQQPEVQATPLAVPAPVIPDVQPQPLPEPPAPETPDEPSESPATPPEIPVPEAPIVDEQTLTELESVVDSPHLTESIGEENQEDTTAVGID
ncbi:hypothetical protein H0X10_04110, partial [Candidatus Saccharibacteria bacterium]|nr:hypothetical protein [Candidatus Saccharibacteria bacterium]